MSLTWSQSYKAVHLAPGKLAQTLEAIMSRLAVGRALKVSITRHDDLLENLGETNSGENEYGVLDTVCVLGRKPHREISAIWTERGRGLFLNLTLGASSRTDGQLSLIVTATDGRVLNAFVEQLERRLGLARIPEATAVTRTPEATGVVPQEGLQRAPSGLSSSSPVPQSPPPDVELRKVNRAGIWGLIAASVTAAGAILATHC